MKYLSIVLCTLALTISVIAQDSCSALVTDALSTLDTLCEATSRNELCYGNNDVSVTTYSGDDVAFAQPGDIVSIVDIASIHTSPFAEPDEWGIALMRVQANIPDTLPGANVTFLLFGDVTLSNAESVSTTLSASTTGSVNIRSGPSTNHATAGSLQPGTALELIGRNAAGEWVYFTSEDGTSGWLFASLLQIEGDVMTLDAVPDDFAGSSAAMPMQAVYFSSGIGELTCGELPQDGLLIQTPNYEQPIELTLNDVAIRLGSTVYIQAEAGGNMTVYVVEGFAFVTANDETVNVPEGAVTTIEIDADLHATGTPSDPEPYGIEEVSSAPVSTLDEPVAIAESASEDVIADAGHGIVGYWIDREQSQGGFIVAAFIIPLGGNRYQQMFINNRLAEEHPCFGGTAIGVGDGPLVDNVLSPTGTIRCSSGEVFLSDTEFLDVIYNPDTDTITIEGTDIDYERQ